VRQASAAASPAATAQRAAVSARSASVRHSRQATTATMPNGSDSAVDAIATIGVDTATMPATTAPSRGEPEILRVHTAASTTSTPNSAALSTRAADSGASPRNSRTATAAGNAGGNSVSGLPSMSAKPWPVRRCCAAARYVTLSGSAPGP